MQAAPRVKGYDAFETGSDASSSFNSQLAIVVRTRPVRR